MSNTVLDLEAERVSFEAATPGLNHLRGKLGAYCSDVVHDHWQGWLLCAARRATIQPTAAEPVQMEVVGYVCSVSARFMGRAQKDEGSFGDCSKLYNVPVYAETEKLAPPMQGVSPEKIFASRAPVAPADAVRDARDLALEEAESACQDVIDEADRDSDCEIASGAYRCRDAIRAMKSNAPTEGQQP